MLADSLFANRNKFPGAYKKIPIFCRYLCIFCPFLSNFWSLFLSFSCSRQPLVLVIFPCPCYIFPCPCYTPVLVPAFDLVSAFVPVTVKIALHLVTRLSRMLLVSLFSCRHQVILPSHAPSFFYLCSDPVTLPIQGSLPLCLARFLLSVTICCSMYLYS